MFVTKRGGYFWPASNPHPTHEVYPEFDPRRPIEADSSWSFRFDKSGEWRYHDHLAPLFEGKIVVRETERDFFRSSPLGGRFSADCSGVERNSDKIKCWEEMLDSALKEKGLEAAFDVFADLYQKEPEFAQKCHSFTHKLGKAGYEMFARRKDFLITPKAAYCSYGFFHGFTEALVQESNSLDGLREACEYIERNMNGETSMLTSCLHGIGHGFTDGSDPRARGNEWAIIKPGLALCEKIGRNESEVGICSGGVFNSLAEMYLKPEYNLALDKDDPLRICRNQLKSYFKRACFMNFKGLTMWIFGNDFSQAAKFYAENVEDKYAPDAMDNLATYAVRYMLKDDNLNEAVGICHRLSNPLRVNCITGLGAGLMTFGLPEKEYVRAIDFCRSALLAEEERAECFKRVVQASFYRYSFSKYKNICESIEEKYRTDCDFVERQKTSRKRPD